MNNSLTLFNIRGLWETIKISPNIYFYLILEEPNKILNNILIGCLARVRTWTPQSQNLMCYQLHQEAIKLIQ